MPELCVVPGQTRKAIGYGLVHWPLEVRLCIAGFLAWRELVADALLCRSWHKLEAEDALWQVYFRSVWPRLARRKDARTDSRSPWRVLFRARWGQSGRAEDALEEDWLDFNAAQDLQAADAKLLGTSVVSSIRHKANADEELQQALRRCMEALKAKGVNVPSEQDKQHSCTSCCRYHRLPVKGDVFVCQVSGKIHRCSSCVPCHECVLSIDEAFLVCPASGRCFQKTSDASEEAAEAASANDWDPELSMTQQFGRWFEQGYFMSEEQAKDFFGMRSRGSSRRIRGTQCHA